MGFLSRMFGISAVTADDVLAKIAKGEEPLLLDIREADEWAAEHIAGATWIPMGELHDRLAELPKNREIVCVCRSGSRSLFATNLLKNSGYKASNLQGGMIRWTGPVERGA